MGFLNFLQDKEEVIWIDVEKEFEVPRVKVELIFVGKRDETVRYVCHVNGYGPYGMAQTPNDILEDFVNNYSHRRYTYELPNDNLILHKDHYTLASGKILDTTTTTVKALVKEKKIVRK